MTPLWSLSIDNGGTSSPASGDLGFQNTEGFVFENESLSLSNLTGLTDTTVTFTFDFTQEDRANSVNIIANTMDDIVLTGTAAAVPEPGVWFLLSAGSLGFAFVRRRPVA